MNTYEDYTRHVDDIARQEIVYQEDLEFIASFFEKSLQTVMMDFLEKKTVITLAEHARQYLN